MEEAKSPQSSACCPESAVVQDWPTAKKGGVAGLTDATLGPALGPLYVPLRNQLVRQARELLLCRHGGDYGALESRTLRPAAALYSFLLTKHHLRNFENDSGVHVDCKTCTLKLTGWPVTYGEEGLAVHLGELDGGLLRPGEGYFGLGPGARLTLTARPTTGGPLERRDMQQEGVGPERPRCLLVAGSGRDLRRVDWDDYTEPRCNHGDLPFLKMRDFIEDIDFTLIEKECLILLDTLDSSGRPVVAAPNATFQEPSSGLVATLRYLHAMGPQHHSDAGLLVVMDSNLDELPEVLVELNGNHLSVQVKPISEVKELLDPVCVPKSLGGSWTGYDPAEWVSCHKELSGLICRYLEVRGRLERYSASLRADLPTDNPQKHLDTLRQDLTTLDLPQDSGDIELSVGTDLLRFNICQVRKFYRDTKQAVESTKKHAEGHLVKLEQKLQQQILQEETNQVAQWLETHTARLQERAIPNSLAALKQEEEEFERFYFSATRQLERAQDLLEEGPPESGRLASSVAVFSELLEDSRDGMEDRARCYHLIDKSYEWALEAMRFVSQMRLAGSEDAETLLASLLDHVAGHPALPESHFTEMAELGARLGTPLLAEQCKVAQSRCQETTQLIRTRLATLRQHAAAEVGEQGETRCPRLKSHASSIWTGGSQRRKSLPYTCPPSINSYTTFPALGLKEESHLEEEVLGRGPITEDLTTQGPVTSISRSVLESRLGPRPLAAPRNPLRPAKGALSWQLCEDTLDKVTARVREQNERLASTETLSGSSEGDSGIADHGPIKPQLSHTLSDPLQGPVPVNSHLLTRTTSLDSSSLKTKKTLHLIMKEMIQTEQDYVKSLEYIIENYIPEVLRDDIPQALRGQRNVLFGNIEKINEFHRHYFLEELEMCEDCPFMVGQCFLNFESQFYLYALYNKNKPKSDALMAEYGAAFFKEKQLALQDKMDLASYLLKPVQRMGKYALLLKQLLKECPPNEADYHDLKAAEEMVRFQLRHGNDLLAMDALRDCDVNVKEQGQLLCQDELLVCQGRGKKALRHVFLFEDLILFSKAKRDPEKKSHDVYQYKQSFKTTDIGLTEQIGDSPTKFEIWFRKRKVQDTYILQAHTPEVRNSWVQEISKLLWKQALRNREMRLAEMSSMGIGSKPCLDIRPSDDQIHSRFVNLQRGTRFRNSIACPEQARSRRPLSVVSVSSSSSGSSSQSFYGTLNLGFEPGDSPPRALQRSLTQHSTESGFCTDASTTSSLDGPKSDRRDSVLSSDSLHELASTPITELPAT